MSLASKVFLGASIAGSAAVVWGVHALQKREQDTMYQGVIKDEIRVRDRAAAAAQLAASAPSTASTSSIRTAAAAATAVPSTTSVPPLNTPSAPVQRPMVSPATHTPLDSSSSSSSSTSSISLRTDTSRRFDEHEQQHGGMSRGSPDRPMGAVGVAQPPPVVDPDCEVCVVSPPPELLEAQSKEERQRERRDRLAEYEAQKALAGRLQSEQGLHQPHSPAGSSVRGTGGDGSSQRLV